MPYEFFFSYTRANNDSYLKKFFDDLSQAVRDKRGLPHAAEVGFFDQHDIELGAQWEDSITEALQTSSVFVPLYSPAYFKSLYCGKEWEAFRLRRAAYAETLPRDNGAQIVLPPVVKPVTWIAPLPPALMPVVAAAHYHHGDPHAVHNVKGMKYMLKQLASFDTAYNQYIDELADEIIAAADAHTLPRLAAMPPLKDLPSAFHATPPPGVLPPPPLPPAPVGPKHVRFVVVAADPVQLTGAVRSPNSYLDNGGSDWKPFYPHAQVPVGVLVQRIVADDELGFTSDFATFNPNLQQEIDRAWDEKKIIVLLIDSWTVDWNRQYQDILRDFDSRNYLHCSVLVPDSDDPELAPRRNAIEQTVRDTFFFRASANNPIFYRDRISSAADLRDVLRDVLTRIKGEIRNRATVMRPVPNNIAKPLVNGPGG